MLLREERDFLAMEKMDNDAFGQRVTCLVEHFATPQEIRFGRKFEQIFYPSKSNRNKLILDLCKGI
jgi:hypothetical protein